VGTPGWDENKNWQITPSKSVLNYSWISPDYVLSTAELNPADTHIAPSSQNRWQGITFPTGSGDRVYPQAGPSNGAPTMNAFRSMQSRNVLITRKQAYSTLPTLLYFPQTLDTIVEQGGWIFVKEGGAYLAVRPALGTYRWLNAAKNKAGAINQRFVQLTNAGAPIIFEARSAKFTASFAAFRADILGNPRSYVGGVLRYTATTGSAYTFFDDATTPRVNGVPINYAPAKVFNSPYMQSTFGSGRITISKGSQSATYDFSKPTQPVKVVH
jgi:hypothetical protein